jgi:hypothetical protein
MASNVLTWADEVRLELVHQIEVVDHDGKPASSSRKQRILADLRLRLALMEKLISVCEEHGDD